MEKVERLKYNITLDIRTTLHSRLQRLFNAGVTRRLFIEEAMEKLLPEYEEKFLHEK